MDTGRARRAASTAGSAAAFGPASRNTAAVGAIEPLVVGGHLPSVRPGAGNLAVTTGCVYGATKSEWKKNHGREKNKPRA